MKRILSFLIIPLIMMACTCQTHKTDKQTLTGHPIEGTQLLLMADTIHDGGLCLLHPITIIDTDGNMLFSDSVNDYEPDSCQATMQDDGIMRIVFRRFDPCDDSKQLIILTDGKTILSHRIEFKP